MSENENRTAWWGSCTDEDCLTSLVIYSHPDAEQDLPDEDDWETPLFFLRCPVCGDSMMWGGSDHPKDILKNY